MEEVKKGDKSGDKAIGKSSLTTFVEVNKRGNLNKGWYEFYNGDNPNKRYYLKSKWEFRYAKILELLHKSGDIFDWQYEPDTFYFDKIKRGTNNFKPDFKIFYSETKLEYVEVKGYWDAKSLTKMKRMRIYHPEIKITAISSEYFNGVNKTMGFLWK